MSWTTIKQPTQHVLYPVYDQILWKVYDTSYALSNYRYKVKVLIKPNETAADIIAGTFVFYPLQDGTCEFDVAPILRDYVANNFDDFDIAGFKDVVGPVVKYTLGWYRSFETTVDQFVKYEEWRYSYDGALSIPELLNNDALYAERLRPSLPAYIDPVNMGSVASNVPSTLRLKLKDYYTVDFLASHPVGGWFGLLVAKYVKKISIFTYSQNYLYGYHEYSITRLSMNNSNYFDPSKMWVRAGIGPANLNAIPQNQWDYVGPDQTLLDGAYPIFPVIDNYCDYYDVCFIGNDDVSCLKTIRVYPDLCTEATMFPNVTGIAHHVTYRNLDQNWLVYKNKFGAYSWLPFFAKNYKTIDVKKNQYDKRLGYGTSIYSRSNSAIGSAITETYSLNSDYVPVCEQGFYEELLCSPSVYLIKPTLADGTSAPYEPALPVTVKEGSYTIQTQKNVKLVQYAVEVQAHSQKIIQRS